MELFRCLFLIHISSKNSSNQATAKAALNQIIHMTFKKMDLSYVSIIRVQVQETS